MSDGTFQSRDKQMAILRETARYFREAAEAEKKERTAKADQEKHGVANYNKPILPGGV